MASKIIVSIVVAAICLSAQPVHAQKHPDYEIDFSKSRLDSTDRALCTEFIDTPLQLAIASSGMDPKLIPAFIDVENYPAGAAIPKLKIIYASDGELFSELLVLRRLADGDYEVADRTQNAPPGHQVKLRVRDVTGDGTDDLIASSRGGRPSMESFMLYVIDDSSHLYSISDHPKGPHDPSALHGVAVGLFDSLGHDGRPAFEVWQDDSLHFAARYVRVRHQYDEGKGRFLPTTVDTLSELPYWCDKRRAMYIPQE